MSEKPMLEQVQIRDEKRQANINYLFEEVGELKAKINLLEKTSETNKQDIKSLMVEITKKISFSKGFWESTKLGVMVMSLWVAVVAIWATFEDLTSFKLWVAGLLGV